MGQCGHLIFLRRRKGGLGVAKTLGDCIRIGADDAHDRSTERLRPLRPGPERPRCAPDDEGNNSNNYDAAHTHDGIGMAPLRIDLRPRSRLHNPCKITRRRAAGKFRESVSSCGTLLRH